MDNLNTLHLGGNALSGSLRSAVLSASLTELVLSSNSLTGDVPNEFFTSNISTLDLSLNRFQGTIPGNAFTSTTGNVTIKLHNNRLSGSFPASLLNLPPNQVNILEGNMFSCHTDRKDLPENDPKYDSYICGSDSTNISLIAFGAVFIAGISVMSF
jgi:hypothetical protein